MTTPAGRMREAVGPASWPLPPVDVSISSLRELESCPRRWALGAADYPEIWDRRGYPRKLHAVALEGTVVHLALERVVHRLSEAGCPSVSDASAVEVMKALGGYTALARASIESVLQSFEGNPRAAPAIDAARSRLEFAIPEIRATIQVQLSRLQLQPTSTSADFSSDRGGSKRLPLELGSHVEVTLRDEDLGWFGISDLITLTVDQCEIRDFKTGKRSEKHAFQLQVYALLWCRDAERNPSRRKPTKLTLAYRNGDVSVEIPEEAELESLARELARRGQLAKASVAVSPPEARPSLDNCRYCSVRHLCDEYWTPSTQRLLESEADEEYEFGDVQILVETPHGPTSWDGRLEVAKLFPGGRPVLLRTNVDDPGFGVGDRVRVLDVHITERDADDVGDRGPVVATMAAASEAFVIPAEAIGATADR